MVVGLVGILGTLARACAWRGSFVWIAWAEWVVPVSIAHARSFVLSVSVGCCGMCICGNRYVPIVLFIGRRAPAHG